VVSITLPGSDSNGIEVLIGKGLIPRPMAPFTNSIGVNGRAATAREGTDSCSLSAARNTPYCRADSRSGRRR
jgi:hypothetical protein